MKDHRHSPAELRYPISWIQPKESVSLPTDWQLFQTKHFYHLIVFLVMVWNAIGFFHYTYVRIVTPWPSRKPGLEGRMEVSALKMFGWIPCLRSSFLKYMVSEWLPLSCHFVRHDSEGKSWVLAYDSYASRHNLIIRYHGADSSTVQVARYETYSSRVWSDRLRSSHIQADKLTDLKWWLHFSGEVGFLMPYTTSSPVWDLGWTPFRCPPIFLKNHVVSKSWGIQWLAQPAPVCSLPSH